MIQIAVLLRMPNSMDVPPGLEPKWKKRAIALFINVPLCL